MNTAIGAGTLLFNTGDNNTATGALALLNNTGGFYSTADGAFALFSNTSGSGNTATGYQALSANEDSDNNAAYGYIAFSNSTSDFNTAFGSQTLVSDTSGRNNTAIGYQALLFNTTGNFNIAIGAYAGVTLPRAPAILISIMRALGGESGTIRIGQNQFHSATYLAGIAGQTVGAGGSTCYVDNDGKMGVFLSVRRYKEKIQPMNDVNSALFSLKSVTFRYKPEFDKSGTPHFGLIAEEVAAVAPDLVTHDGKGQFSTVRYEAINVMLLNEFLKEYRKVEKLQATVADLAAQLQKVSARIEMETPAMRLAVESR